MADYYQTLGVDKKSTEAQIKSAYRKLALKFHPDRNQGDKAAEEKFKEISEAYAVLSDPDKRTQYDQFGASGFHQRYSTEDIFRGTDFGSIFNEFGFQGGGDGGGGFDDIFATLFGMGGARGGHGHSGFGRQGFQSRPARGQDVEYPLTISFMDAYAGAEKKISFRLSDGTQREISVKIPAGVAGGTKMRVSGRGAPSSSGGPAGDLYVIVSIAPDLLYQRLGDDIEVPIKLKFSEAVLGATKEVQTPEGTKKLKVPAGVSSGTKIRLRGLGFPHSGSKTRGDLYAVVTIEVPQKISRDQQKIIEALHDAGL